MRLSVATTTGTVRTAVGLAIAVGAACLVYYFYSTNYFFPFCSIVPRNHSLYGGRIHAILTQAFDGLRELITGSCAGPFAICRVHR